MRNPPEILIIGDMEDNASLLSQELQRAGYHTICADNGTDGYELALSRLPGLIILDVMMSGKNGYEVYECLKKNNLTSGIPVIFVTARDDFKDADYITRPFQNSEILARVRTHLKLKAMYEENLEYYKELMHFQKMASIAILTGAIAHDINNYTGTAMGYADMLQDNLGNSEKALRYVQMILGATQRVADLTKSLLTYSQAWRGSESRVDVGKLLEKMVNLYKNRTEDKVHVDLETPEDILEVYGDQDRILQALANIFINAQEFTPDNGVITIKANKGKLPEKYQKPESIDGDYVIISISDTGPGIDKDALEKIFEPLKQTVDANLGLSAACRIIQKHGGAISVDTRPGEGSTFHIYLPIKQGD